MKRQTAGTTPPAPSGHGARVYNSTAHQINDFTETAVGYAAEVYDTDGFHNTVTNNTRLTIPANFDGIYVIGATNSWVANNNGHRVTAIRLNGTTYIAEEREGPVMADVYGQTIETQYELSAGDYVECVVLQNSGGQLELRAVSSYSPHFYIALIGLT